MPVGAHVRHNRIFGRKQVTNEKETGYTTYSNKRRFAFEVRDARVSKFGDTGSKFLGVIYTQRSLLGTLLTIHAKSPTPT